MNKLLTILILFLNLGLLGQTYKFYQTENIHNQLRLNTKTGEVYQIQDDGQKFMVHYARTPNDSVANRYKLYETENMWNYILLDQFSGKLWQCQFSTEGLDYISSWPINIFELSDTSRSKFTIEPLVSMFQFYLINQETGEMWKFQWSTDGDEYRWIEKH